MVSYSPPSVVAACRRFLVVSALCSATFACNSSPEGIAVTISLPVPAQAVSSVTVVADYSHTGANLVIAGGKPACAVLPPGMSVNFSRRDGDQLVMTARGSAPFSAPIDLAVCRMAPRSEGLLAGAIAGALRFSITAATGPDGEAFNEEQLAALSREAGHGSRNGQGSKSGNVASSGSPDPTPSRDMPDDQAAARPQGEPAPSAPDSLRQRETSSGERNRNRLEEREREGIEAREEATAQEGEGSLDAPLELYVEGEDADGDGFEDDEENDKDVRRKTPAYDCYVDITSNSGQLTALKFNVFHAGNTGGWQGSKSRVSCSWSVGGEVTLCSDSGAGRLRCAFVSDVGFETPSPVLSCVFRSEQPVVPGNFNVEVIDAFDINEKPVAVDMLVSAVVPH